MGLLSFFAGKSPEEMELAGDKFFKVQEFGAAKIEYEKAAKKAETKFPERVNFINRINQKITDSRESLARTHFQNSRQLIESGNPDDANDLLNLALELTEDDNLKNEINVSIKELHRTQVLHEADNAAKFFSGTEPFPTEEEIDSDEQYFGILANALPEDIREEYLSYSQAFKQGYIALNNGDFQTAVAKFTDAMQNSEGRQPMIPIELATALSNLRQYDRARNILEDFIAEHPEDVRAYEVLCDLYWINQDYDAAIALIGQCPDSLNETLSIRMLHAETCYQMGHYAEAEALFISCEEKFGQTEIISRALAKTYEAMEELEKARDVYARILSGCTKCGVRSDPFIQQRYAELCFACGERSERLLTLYLSIMRDDPENKDSYYQPISELYEALGNTEEANRYKSFF